SYGHVRRVGNEDLFYQGFEVCFVHCQAGLCFGVRAVPVNMVAFGNYPEALNWCEKSKEILERIGDRHHLAMCLENIGTLYRDISEKEKARQYLKESLKLYNQLNLKSKAEEISQILALL
ncbi:MAG: tetratricopeptide repeat protein, partial [bacterium]